MIMSAVVNLTDVVDGKKKILRIIVCLVIITMGKSVLILVPMGIGVIYVNILQKEYGKASKLFEVRVF